MWHLRPVVGAENDTMKQLLVRKLAFSMIRDIEPNYAKNPCYRIRPVNNPDIFPYFYEC